MSFALSLAALLAVAPTVQVMGTDEKREPKKDDVIVEIEWVTPLPGFQLAFSLSDLDAWHVVDLGGKPGPFARFAAKTGRQGLRYLVFQQAAPRARWQILEGGKYDCPPGGRIAATVRTELAADGRLRLAARYHNQGCAVTTTSRAHEAQGRLRSDPPPPPTCCVDERLPVRSTFVRRCAEEPWAEPRDLPLGEPPPSIADDVLTVVLAHGGCGSDELSLCYRPLASAASKLRLPFQTHYRHDGPRCGTRHVERHAFDLGNLKRDYLRTFGRPPQPVTLVIPGVGDVPYLP